MARDFEAMLAVPLGNHRASDLLTNDKWGAQEKADGHRVMIATDPQAGVTVYNRSGQPRQHAIPEFMTTAFGKVPFKAVFDGELVGTNGDSKLQLFDLPSAGDQVSATDPYSYRFSVLDQFVTAWNPSDRIEVLPLAESEAAKRALLMWTEDNAREGVIFKKLDARYQHGRRSLSVVKYKFRQDGDVIVLDKGVDGKDNLVLGAYENGTIVEVGHCTALSGDGFDIQIGDVITVNYVHFSKGGRLVQPTLPRLRKMDDKLPTECTTDQFRTAYGK